MRDGHSPRKTTPRAGRQAALVLGKLEPLASNQRAYDRLLHVMKHDEDADVRDAAYGALVRLARARELGDGGQAR